MKKLFIQCLVIVMCFSIFNIPSVFVETIHAANDNSLLYWNQTVRPTGTWKVNGKQVEEAYTFTPASGQKGIEMVVYKVPGATGEKQYQADFYKDGQKQSPGERVASLQAASAAGSTFFQKKGWLENVGDRINDTKKGLDPAQAMNNAINSAVNGAVSSASNWLKEIAYGAIYYWTKFVSWIVGGVGLIFDSVLTKLTPTSATEPGSSLTGINTSIKAAWTIIRDVASIVLIFSLLYLGIKTILDGNGFADKKTLVSIIVAAIFLNFSLLFVRDVAFFVSNRVGREILQTAVVNNTTGGSSATGQPMSFSESMLNMIGPQALFKTSGSPVTTYNPAQFSGMNWGQVFMFLIQTVILTFVLVIAILIFVWLIGLLLVRFVIFIILMISAPLAVIAFVVPWLKSQGNMWLDELKKQVIFFPAFVFTMYIIFLIIGTLGSGASMQAISINTDGAFDQTAVTFFLNFALIIGFMVTLLIVPGKLSKGGAQFMGKMSSWGEGKIRGVMSGAGRSVTRTVGGATFGTAAALGRNTVGRIATRTLSSDKIRSIAQQEKGVGGMFARARLNMADKAQNMSFDARATKFGGDLAKKYNLGTASAGWKTTVENKTKALKTKQEKEMKLYGFGEDLPNAGKTRAEVKNTAIRDTLQKSLEQERREITRLQGSTKPRDVKKVQKLKDSIAEKETKLAAVYVNQDKFNNDRKKVDDTAKKAKDEQIKKATELRDTEETALKKLKEQAEKETDEKAKAEINTQIKVREDAFKVQDKVVKELQTEHDTIGVSPKEKHAKEIAIAEASRNNTAKELKAAKEKLQKAKASGNQNEMDEALKEMETHQKALGELETEVGRLMNRGADQYLKFADSRRKFMTEFMGVSVDQSGKVAMEKMAKETKKSWQEKGKANVKSEKKDKKDTTATNTTPASTPAPGSVASNNLAAADAWAGRHS